MKYQVMLDAAQERLELLRKVGGKENQVAIAQTQALITELNNKIGKSTRIKKTNVFQLLGFDVKDDEASQIVDSYRRVFSSASLFAFSAAFLRSSAASLFVLASQTLNSCIASICSLLPALESARIVE